MAGPKGRLAKYLREEFGDEVFYHGSGADTGLPDRLDPERTFSAARDPNFAQYHATMGPKDYGHEADPEIAMDAWVDETPSISPVVFRRGNYASERDVLDAANELKRERGLSDLAFTDNPELMYENLEPRFNTYASDLIGRLQERGFIGADFHDADPLSETARMMLSDGGESRYGATTKSRMAFNPEEDVKSTMAKFEGPGMSGRATPGALATIAGAAGGAAAVQTQAGNVRRESRERNRERAEEKRQSEEFRRSLLMGEDRIEAPEHPRILAGVDAVRQIPVIGDYVPFMDQLEKLAWGDELEPMDYAMTAIDAADFVPLTGPPGTLAAVMGGARRVAPERVFTDTLSGYSDEAVNFLRKDALERQDIRGIHSYENERARRFVNQEEDLIPDEFSRLEAAEEGARTGRLSPEQYKQEFEGIERSLMDDEQLAEEVITELPAGQGRMAGDSGDLTFNVETHDWGDTDAEMFVEVYNKDGDTVGGISADVHPEDGVIQISISKLDDEFRGQGYGMQMYDKLLEAAREKGYHLASDRTVSAAASKVYEALERRGYEVVKNPMAKFTGDGQWSVPIGQSVFTVNPER